MGEAFDSTLAAARTGAEWAWADLYRQFAPAILGYLRAQRAADAEDLTAETFFQVVKSLGQFDGDESAFRSWLFVIAHRKMIDAGRWRSRRPLQPVEDEVLAAYAGSGDVEREAIANLGVAELEALLSKLTDSQRDVLLLRIVAGLSLEETAGVLDLRAGAVSALQRRALKRLEKTLQR